MSELLGVAAAELSRRWIGDVQPAELIGTYMTEKLTALLGGVCAASRVPAGAAGDRVLRGLFAVPASEESTEGAAAYIAGLIIGWLPEDMRSLTAALRAQQAPPTGGSSVSSSQSGMATGLSRVLRDLAEQAGVSPEDLQALRDAATVMASIGPPRRWSWENVERALRRLITRFLVRGFPSVRRAAIEILAEMREVPLRVGIASAFTGAGIAMRRRNIPARGSTRNLGQEVHTKLQEKYRGEFRANFIMQEDILYRPGRPPAALGASWRTGWRADGTVLALYLARQTVVLAPADPLSETNLRDDTVDLTRFSTYEIKPLRGAAPGVIQEFFYRSTFNLYAAVVQDLLGLPVVYSRLRAGERWDNLAKGLLAPFAAEVEPVTVVPFCIDLLPGLVLYAVVRLPVEMVLLLIPVIKSVIDEIIERARQLADELREAAEALARIAEQVARVILFGLVLIGLVVTVVLLGWALWAGLGAAAAGLGAAALGAAALGAAMVVGGIIIQRLGQGSESSGEESSSATSSQDEVVTVTFGNCQLVDMPLRLLSQDIIERQLEAAVTGGLTAAFPTPSV